MKVHLPNNQYAIIYDNPLIYDQVIGEINDVYHEFVRKFDSYDVREKIRGVKISKDYAKHLLTAPVKIMKHCKDNSFIQKDGLLFLGKLYNISIYWDKDYKDSPVILMQE